MVVRVLRDSFHDPFVLFGFAAAVTDKLDFVTGVLCLPQRQTAVVAQQAADVDLLSRERLRLGVGAGSADIPNRTSCEAPNIRNQVSKTTRIKKSLEN